MTHAAHVRIFYPADPVGVVPGGIDTFIRGIIKAAPEDLRFSLVGMTTDPSRRPLARWTRCEVGSRGFDFFPAVAVGDAGGRGRVPLSVRYTAALWRHAALLARDFDVFDFHRIEPSFVHGSDPRPRNGFFHQDPKALRETASDNLWKHLPSVYERIEAKAMARYSSAWCVTEAGAATLRVRYPALASQIRFVPTWVDNDVFHPVADAGRAALRARYAAELGIRPESQWIISVGRLDTQKNPHRLLSAFARLRAEGQDITWLAVGDGVLRAELERATRDAGVGDRVRFLGLRAPGVIADMLRAADLYALSSAYEGMPMALLEALGCGLPAVSTDVGEVRRVVRTGVNGVVAAAQEDEAFAAALAAGLATAGRCRGAPALAAVEPYQPRHVLVPVYENYRRLAAVAAGPSATGRAALLAAGGRNG